MKPIKTYLILIFSLLIAMACKDKNNPEVKTVNTNETATTNNNLDPNATYAKAEFTIDGMSCAIGCAKKIEKNIAKMEGVKLAKVDFDKKLAMVEYDKAKINHELLEETVTKTADVYKVTNMKTVDEFSSKKACKKGCTKACCKDKTEAEKKACAKDCKKECCAKKAKV